RGRPRRHSAHSLGTNELFRGVDLNRLAQDDHYQRRPVSWTGCARGRRKTTLPYAFLSLFFSGRLGRRARLGGRSDQKRPPSSGARFPPGLERFRPELSGPDTRQVLDGDDPDLAVADLAGSGGRLDLLG